MKIHIPNSAFLGNINAFIKSADFTDLATLNITANEKWMSVHPVVLCMVAALGLKIRATSIVNQPILCQVFTAASKHYFQRMGMFNFLHLDSKMNITEHEPAGRFIPLTQITNAAELTTFIGDMIPLLHLQEIQAQPIRYIVSEIVRNVLEHSGSTFGAIVAAQYYKKTNTIRMGIVDTGYGINKTISYSHQTTSDLDAICMALTPGITGTTSREGGTDYNAGAGLFFTKSISKINKDLFVIYSGNTLYKLLREKESATVVLKSNPLDDRHTVDTDLPYWQGTVIGIDIKLDEHEEFSKLLQYIREIYTTTVRERKSRQYKKAKFI